MPPPLARTAAKRHRIAPEPRYALAPIPVPQRPLQGLKQPRAPYLERLPIGRHLLALALIADAVRGGRVAVVPRRAAPSQGNDVVKLEAPRVSARQVVVYRLPAQVARPALRPQPVPQFCSRVAVVRVLGSSHVCPFLLAVG